LKAVVGLGNPGLNYALTRHNVGFAVVDLYRKLHRVKRRGKVESSSLVFCHDDLLLVKPTTYMNESGASVAEILARHAVSLLDTLIVHDDLDLQLGRMRTLRSGGAGTHKGMRSILEAIGTNEIPRLKIGIEVEDRAVSGKDFVLERFTLAEWDRIVPVMEKAVDAIDLFRTADIEAVMTRFNRET
jgi:PTH1 family peptidyl-tRNA hydrolase